MRKTYRQAVGMIVAVAVVATFCQVVSHVNGQQNRTTARRRGSASISATLNEPETPPGNRLREGAVLSNEIGAFIATGDRITFELAGDKGSLSVLENLALERIWKMLEDTRGRPWSVSGLVTEYRGRNYLLIQRAVLRTRGDNSLAKP